MLGYTACKPLQIANLFFIYIFVLVLVYVRKSTLWFLLSFYNSKRHLPVVAKQRSYADVSVANHNYSELGVNSTITQKQIHHNHYLTKKNTFTFI